jgi:hypothetical protein
MHDITQTLLDEALATLAARHEHVTALKSVDDWRERRDAVRAGLKSTLFAPMPPPLSERTVPRVHSSSDRPPARGDGFDVRRLLIETRPNYVVPSGLWVPDQCTQASRCPAILYSSGHEGPAWRWTGADDWLSGGGDQVALLNLVQRGFIVLSFDPIGQGERQMYDASGDAKKVLNGTQKFAPTAEHEYIHRQLTLLGTSAAAAFVWDMTRIIDYIVSLPFVDAGKWSSSGGGKFQGIGAAGCSGGGTQTAYIASIDQRVYAASIACYTSSFVVDYAPMSPPSIVDNAGIESSWPLGGGGPADGEQTWGAALHLGLDKPDLLIARAPKPTQVLLTSWDQCFPQRGGERAINESLPAWGALRTTKKNKTGGQKRVSSKEKETSEEEHQQIGFEWAVAQHWHGYAPPNREKMYSFMRRAFNWTHGANPTIFPHGVANDTELFATVTGAGSGESTAVGSFSNPSTTYPYAMPFPPYFEYAELRATSSGNVLTAPELIRANLSTTAHGALVLPLLNTAVLRLEQKRRANVVSSSSSFLVEIVATLGPLIGFRALLDDVVAVAANPANGGGGGADPAAAVVPPIISVAGEGHCTVNTQIWSPPTPSNTIKTTRGGSHALAASNRIVLYIGRKGSGGSLAAEEHARVAAINAAGFYVATADLCGFGPAGGGDAFNSSKMKDISSSVDNNTEEFRGVKSSVWGRVSRSLLGGAGPGGGAVVDVAVNVNRSVVGIHAADVLRAAHAALAAVPSSSIAATIAANDTAAAVVSAMLLAGSGTTSRGAKPAPLLGDVALLDSFATWESLARSYRYGMTSYYAWVHGILSHFDLTDMIAASSTLEGEKPPRILILRPQDANNVPLHVNVTQEAFKFAMSVLGDRLQFRLVDNRTGTPSDVDSTIVKWLKRIS